MLVQGSLATCQISDDQHTASTHDKLDGNTAQRQSACLGQWDFLIFALDEDAMKLVYAIYLLGTCGTSASLSCMQCAGGSMRQDSPPARQAPPENTAGQVHAPAAHAIHPPAPSLHWSADQCHRASKMAPHLMTKPKGIHMLHTDTVLPSIHHLPSAALICSHSRPLSQKMTHAKCKAKLSLANLYVGSPSSLYVETGLRAQPGCGNPTN